MTEDADKLVNYLGPKPWKDCTTTEQIERLRSALERIKSADPEIDLGAFYIFAKETAGEALQPALSADEGRK